MNLFTIPLDFAFSFVNVVIGFLLSSSKASLQFVPQEDNVAANELARFILRFGPVRDCSSLPDFLLDKFVLDVG